MYFQKQKQKNKNFKQTAMQKFFVKFSRRNKKCFLDGSNSTANGEFQLLPDSLIQFVRYVNQSVKKLLIR